MTILIKIIIVVGLIGLLIVAWRISSDFRQEVRAVLRMLAGAIVIALLAFIYYSIPQMISAASLPIAFTGL